MKRLAMAGLALALATGVAGIPASGAVVNSRRALSQVVSQLSVDGASLGKTIDYLRDTSGANIVVNWKVLEASGVTQETPISLQVKDLSLRKMLTLVLEQASPDAQLVFSVDSNVIQITSQEDADKQMIVKIYEVADLIMAPANRSAPTLNLGISTTSGTGGGGGGLGGSGGSNGSGGGSGSGSSGGGIFGSQNSSGTPQDAQKTAQQRGDDLADLIRQVIRPNIWRENGGPASIRFFAGKLLVTAPASVQEAIGGPVGNAAVRYGS